jgi:hypothetical protein
MLEEFIGIDLAPCTCIQTAAQDKMPAITLCKMLAQLFLCSLSSRLHFGKGIKKSRRFQIKALAIFLSKTVYNVNLLT